MGHGIGMWIMSKVVMLIFLFLTFSIVVGFMRIGQEKISNDGAKALTDEIKGVMENMMSTSNERSSIYIPVPKTLPERAYGLESRSGTNFKEYEIVFGRASGSPTDLLWNALAWKGEQRQSTTESFSVASSANVDPLMLTNAAGKNTGYGMYYYGTDTIARIDSGKHSFIYIYYEKGTTEPKMCITGCYGIDNDAVNLYVTRCDVECPKP